MSQAIALPPVCHIGVGIDTARYGHHVTFLREDRQSAAKPLTILESNAGYESLREAFERIERDCPSVHFHIHLDAAGPYSANLESFIHALPIAKTVSVGEPLRNKNYREAHFPKRKSDVADSHANARFAIVERPRSDEHEPAEYRQLREVVQRLESQVRQTSRLVNQLHNLMSRVFPELATLAPSLGVGSMLRLLKDYPSAERIAKARLSSLKSIPYLKSEKAQAIQAAAKQSVGSFRGEIAEELVRDQVLDVQCSRQAERKLEKLVEKALDALPDSNHTHLQTIPGIGKMTAAVFVAKIISIDRFQSPGQLVSYFGLFPEEASSGVDKSGQPLPSRKNRMSKKGNDLVRKYLWHAARTGILYNPAIRSLYAKQRARGKRGDVSLGHCMRKLLHLVFAIWKSGKPFDLSRYPADVPEKATGRNEDLASKDKRSP
jgi:transposase